MMKYRGFQKKERGFSLIEVIFAIAILSALFLAIAKYFEVSAHTTHQTLMEGKAGFLLEEGVEAVDLLRDGSYQNNIVNLQTAKTYYLSWNGTQWVATTTPEIIGGTLHRKFTLSDVYRNSAGDIASSGTLDSGTKKLTMSVSWKDHYSNQTSTESLESYIINLYND
jgi:prepilin-type N-terminal cleavage/methylation domain-containing protein